MQTLYIPTCLIESNLLPLSAFRNFMEKADGIRSFYICVYVRCILIPT